MLRENGASELNRSVSSPTFSCRPGKQKGESILMCYLGSACSLKQVSGHSLNSKME